MLLAMFRLGQPQGNADQKFISLGREGQVDDIQIVKNFSTSLYFEPIEKVFANIADIGDFPNWSIGEKFHDLVSSTLHHRLTVWFIYVRTYFGYHLIGPNPTTRSQL
mmetsp:Transcript_45114/g.51822  ORF Transcript_45114/g.51822 Transcript_45114/m.51822 type:complete len:107 (-) Transcript_45114:20-340(-)